MFIFGTCTIVFFERLMGISDRKITFTATFLRIQGGYPGSIELNELLHHLVTQSLGVSPEAAEALKKLEGIESVLHLATSIFFDAARKIVSAARDPASPVFRCGKVSKDLVRDAFWRSCQASLLKLLVSVPGGLTQKPLQRC